MSSGLSDLAAYQSPAATSPCNFFVSMGCLFSLSCGKCSSVWMECGCHSRWTTTLSDRPIITVYSTVADIHSALQIASGQVRSGSPYCVPFFSRRKRSMHFSILHFWVDGSLMPSKMWLDICYCYHGLESMTRFLYFLVILNEESKSRIWISFFSEPPFIIRQADVQSYQFLLAELRARLAYQLQNKLNFWLNYAHRDSKTLAWSLISLTICGPQPSPRMLLTTWSINNLFLHGLGLTNCWLQVP
jgi:hypothetical protein